MTPTRYAGRLDAHPVPRRRRAGSREFACTDTVRANLDAFADAALGKAAYPFADAEMNANIAMLEALCQSAATGRPVEPAP